VSARILVGTCSWTDPTLIDCERFYPRKDMSAEERLRYYAAAFPIVEVDSTYYGPPTARNAGLWAQRTPPGFVFNIKAYAMLTGHAGRVDRLPAALRPEIAVAPLDEKGRPRNLYLDHLTATGRDMLWETHRAELQPLRDAGKLGALLFQFPPWFRRTRRNVALIAELPHRLPGDRIAVEFRGGGWMDPDAAAATLALLEEHGLSYVCVDEPQGFVNSTPPVTAVTAPLAYVRLHGRNAATWESRGPTAAHRFNYLYSQEELEEWAPRLRELARGAETVHVLFNNNYQDVGIRNARQMTMLLDG
jgi:uncharacterized protein YecE (DUF72 family)